jgi:predicted NBD/HSP70 family sugar kinase
LPEHCARPASTPRTAQQVVDLVKRGNIEAIQAIRQAGRDIGEVLTACVSLINPSVIAIGGSMAKAGEHLIAGVREVVYTRSMPLATEHLSIVQSSAGSNAAVIGASMLAIHHALSPRTSTRWPADGRREVTNTEEA